MSIFARRGGPLRTVERFCAASNANDIVAATDLMAAGFRVIDSTGEAIVGRANVTKAMRRFFKLAPDYRIEVTSMSSRGNEVFVRGRALCSDERLRGEMLWRAVADGRRMHEWQSYSPEGGPHLTRILMPELRPERTRARAG